MCTKFTKILKSHTPVCVSTSDDKIHPNRQSKSEGRRFRGCREGRQSDRTETKMEGTAGELEPLSGSSSASAFDGIGGSSSRSTIRNAALWCLAAVVVLLVLLPVLTSWFLVQPGEIGVVVTMGRVASYGPGPHFRLPYVSHLHMFSSKTQKLDEKNSVPTKEGLTVQLDTAM